MSTSFILTAILGVASVAASPEPTRCVTSVTVTTSLTGTTTVYKEMAAVPWEVDCKDCDLAVITETVGSEKPTVTVTSDFLLTNPPICTQFPTPPSRVRRAERRARRASLDVDLS